MHTTKQQDNQTTTQLNNKTTKQQDNTEHSESNPGRNLGGNDGTEGAVWKTVPCIESVLVLSVLPFREIPLRSGLVFKLLGRFLVHWLYGVKTRQNKSYAFTSQKLCFYLLITMLLQSPLFLSPQRGRKYYVLRLVNKVENAYFL